MEECIHLLDPSTCTICNGKDAKQKKIEYNFPAKYSGRVSCGHYVEEGDPLYRVGSGDLICENCSS